jgi:hypothetical protein
MCILNHAQAGQLVIMSTDRDESCLHWTPNYGAIPTASNPIRPAKNPKLLLPRLADSYVQGHESSQAFLSRSQVT